MRPACIVTTCLLLLAAGCGDDPAGAEADAAPDVLADSADGAGGDVTPDLPDQDGDAAPDVDGGDVADVEVAPDAEPDADAGPEVADADAADAAEADADGDGEVLEDGDTAPDGDGDTTDAEADAETSGPDAADGEVGPDVEPDAGCETAADCPDPGPCAEATCDAASGTCGAAPLEDGLPCDDGNACSLDETCQGGVCTGDSALACDDGNPCTDDLCVPTTGCVHNNNFAVCDDGDPCTTDDRCEAGACAGGEPACDDGNPCTADACDADTGACSHEADDDLACSDGSACTLGDHCVAGACVPGSIDGCEDGNACTDDICQEGTCAHLVLHGEPCDDGDVCTVEDVCSAGVCTAGSAEDCDDGSACTVDACDPVAGCTHEPTPGEACDDGDACTTGDTCDAEGACRPDGTVECADGNPCTGEACDPVAGCTLEPVDVPCDDGDICTDEDTCAGGTCQGAPIPCDDGDACSDDTCDPLLGCQHVDASAACSDGNPCTLDSCDPAVGCVNAPKDVPCDDGDPCTVADTCALGTCAGVPMDCDDADRCTLDVCDPEEGCVNEPFTGPCEDGDACTEGETCEADAVCDGSVAVDPDDGVACTADSCDPAVGTSHEPDWTACAVGEACDPEAGCVPAATRLVVSRILVLPVGAPAGAGQGQWFALTNVGEGAVDLTTLRVINSATTLVRIRPASGDPEGPVVLAPGETAAGIKAPPEGTPVPEGFTFVYGKPEDPFALKETGDILTFLDGPAVLVGVFDFSVVSQGPDVPAGALPLTTGTPTALDAGVLAGATTSKADDDMGAWCIRPAGGVPPEGPQPDCGRARLNEVALAGADGARWLELFVPYGGPLDGLHVRIHDADGSLLADEIVPGGRAPLGPLPLLMDGEDGLVLPALGAGSVQLLRDDVLLDVYGFGELSAESDGTAGLPLAEGTPGPALPEGALAVRVQDGVDTDDNAADWTLDDTGTPGELSP